MEDYNGIFSGQEIDKRIETIGMAVEFNYLTMSVGYKFTTEDMDKIRKMVDMGDLRFYYHSPNNQLEIYKVNHVFYMENAQIRFVVQVKSNLTSNLYKFTNIDMTVDMATGQVMIFNYLNSTSVYDPLSTDNAIFVLDLTSLPEGSTSMVVDNVFEDILGYVSNRPIYVKYSTWMALGNILQYDDSDAGYVNISVRPYHDSLDSYTVNVNHDNNVTITSIDGNKLVDDRIDIKIGDINNILDIINGEVI